MSSRLSFMTLSSRVLYRLKAVSSSPLPHARLLLLLPPRFPPAPRLLEVPRQSSSYALPLAWFSSSLRLVLPLHCASVSLKSHDSGRKQYVLCLAGEDFLLEMMAVAGLYYWSSVSPACLFVCFLGGCLSVVLLFSLVFYLLVYLSVYPCIIYLFI